MGSGKSVVGARVAELADAPFFDLDKMVEEEVGVTVAEFFESHGEPAFRAIEKKLLPNALQPGAVVALGGGAVIDRANWALIDSRSTAVYLQVPFSMIWERIRVLKSRPLIAGRSRDEVEALFEERRQHYERAAFQVHADRPVEAVADAVMKLWSG